LFSFIQQRLGRRGLAVGLIAGAAGAVVGLSLLADPTPSTTARIPLPDGASTTPAALAVNAAKPAMHPLAVSAAAPLRNANNAARDLECLTQAIYFEARGEDVGGQAAVAQVVMNRVKHPAFPKTVCGVVRQGAGGRGCQFSFICDGRAERATERRAWSRAQTIAAKALVGQVAPQVGAATHFHVAALGTQWPGMVRVGQVGLHVFYRFAPRGTKRPVEPERATLTALPLEPIPAVMVEAPQAEAEPAPVADAAELHAAPAADAS
jgi:hypothetical protein